MNNSGQTFARSARRSREHSPSVFLHVGTLTSFYVDVTVLDYMFPRLYTPCYSTPGNFSPALGRCRESSAAVRLSKVARRKTMQCSRRQARDLRRARGIRCRWPSSTAIVPHRSVGPPCRLGGLQAANLACGQMQASSLPSSTDSYMTMGCGCMRPQVTTQPRLAVNQSSSGSDRATPALHISWTVSKQTYTGDTVLYS